MGGSNSALHIAFADFVLKICIAIRVTSIIYLYVYDLYCSLPSVHPLPSQQTDYLPL